MPSTETTTESDQRNAHSKRRLAPSVSELLAEQQDGLPFWVRAPRRGYERFSGLTRAKLYQLASDGLIESASLRENGKTRGCRLFKLRTILAHIEANRV
jgi:hypothetical protein